MLVLGAMDAGPKVAGKGTSLAAGAEPITRRVSQLLAVPDTSRSDRIRDGRAAQNGQLAVRYGSHVASPSVRFDRHKGVIGQLLAPFGAGEPAFYCEED
jgi:hypothetical protein